LSAGGRTTNHQPVELLGQTSLVREVGVIVPKKSRQAKGKGTMDV
jgi:hypothetical protein